MGERRASVVIPVYNQYDSLIKVLNGFSKQTISKDLFEIVLIDDGSDDELKSKGFFLAEKFNDITIKYIRQKNSGRAVARNIGIRNSDSNLVIFCDADRYPAVNYVEQHILSHESMTDIVIGLSLDYFGKVTELGGDNWDQINKFSRVPPYTKKINCIYNEDGITKSELAWISFLVGNSSVDRKLLLEVGGFDERFTEWGVEHFELALRLSEKKCRFVLKTAIRSYHIPHARLNNFYENRLNDSLLLLKRIHDKVDVQSLRLILLDSSYPLPSTLFYPR